MSTLRANQIQTVAGKPILNSTGSILQVINSVSDSTHFTTTSANFIAIPFSASITPTSSTNKILVLLSGQTYNGTAGCGVVFGMTCNGAIISSGYGTYDVAGGNLAQSSMIVTHLPNTTATCTYTVNIAVTGGGTAYWYGGGYGYYLTLIEVTG
jgi:hypothetical protein